MNRCDLEQRVARLGVGGFGLVTLEAGLRAVEGLGGVCGLHDVWKGFVFCP